MYNTYPRHQNYGPHHNGYDGYAPMSQQQQPMPMQAPVAQSTAASKGLLMVAGLAVVGAAAFGGVFLMNSNSQPQPTAATAPSTVVNIPSTIEIPSLTTSQDDPASPVIVNNPAPSVRVFTPAAPRPVAAPAPAPAPAAAPVPAAAAAPATDPKPADPKEEPKKEEPKKEEPKKEEPKKDGGAAPAGPNQNGQVLTNKIDPNIFQ